MQSSFHFAVLLIATMVVANAIGAPLDLQPSTGAAAQPRSAHNQNKCGWFINPTPQNMWLDTALTEWIISIQGSYQAGYEAEGDWSWPEFAVGQWVHTNGGSYGYGCVCLRGVFNQATKRVVRIYSVKARSLQACRQNPRLRAKEPPGPAT